MVRKLLLLFTTAVLSIALALPASAHIISFDVGVRGVGYESDSAFASGSITCTAGETYRISLRVRQKTGFKGDGVETGTCDGNPTNWEIQAQETGDAQQGFATVFIYTVRTFASGVEDDKHMEREVLG